MTPRFTISLALALLPAVASAQSEVPVSLGVQWAYAAADLALTAEQRAQIDGLVDVMKRNCVTRPQTARVGIAYEPATATLPRTDERRVAERIEALSAYLRGLGFERLLVNPTGSILLKPETAATKDKVAVSVSCWH